MTMKTFAAAIMLGILLPFTGCRQGDSDSQITFNPAETELTGQPDTMFGANLSITKRAQNTYESIAIGVNPRTNFSKGTLFDFAASPRGMTLAPRNRVVKRNNMDVSIALTIADKSGPKRRPGGLLMLSGWE